MSKMLIKVPETWSKKLVVWLRKMSGVIGYWVHNRLACGQCGGREPCFIRFSV